MARPPASGTIGAAYFRPPPPLDSADSVSQALLPPPLPPSLFRAGRAVVRHPGWAALLGVFVFALVWLIELDVTSFAPPVDDIEQLVWSRGLAWGYYKHPPLPTLLAWAGTRVLGLNAWTGYLLGAATILGGAAIFWRLLRELRGPRYATLALLAGLGITFYNGRLNYYNHNTVLLVVVAASALFAWRAFERRQLRWWVAIGVAMGLGALTKYQVAVSGLSLVLFWVLQRGWRDPVHRLGALLALLIALVLFTPHLLWLPQHDFGPITYAMESSLGKDLSPLQRSWNAFTWLTDQVFNRCAPALLLLAIVAWQARRTGVPEHASASDAPRLRASRELLWCWGLVPLAFIPVLGIASGADLQLQWGTSFLLFFVPSVMELATPAFWDRASQGVAWLAFAGLQVLLLAINIVTSPLGSYADHHWRTFSAARLAAQVGPEARRELGGPVRVVVGNTGEAGALALLLPEKPLVLIDGRYDRSPWVSPQLVAACGAVQVEHARSKPAGFRPVGAPFHRLYWRVIPATGSRGACQAFDPS